MEENPNSKFACKLYWGHMKENEHTATVQRFMLTFFFFNFVTNVYCFSTTYCSNLAMCLCKKHIPFQEYIALQIALHLSLKNFDCKLYVFGVELKHECSFFFFLSLIQYVLCQKLSLSLLQWTANVSSLSVVSFEM